MSRPGYDKYITDSINISNNSPYWTYEERYSKNINNKVYYVDTSDIFNEGSGYMWLRELFSSKVIRGIAIKYKNVDDVSMRGFVTLKERVADDRSISVKNGYLIFYK